MLKNIVISYISSSHCLEPRETSQGGASLVQGRDPDPVEEGTATFTEHREVVVVLRCQKLPEIHTPWCQETVHGEVCQWRHSAMKLPERAAGKLRGMGASCCMLQEPAARS